MLEGVATDHLIFRNASILEGGILAPKNIKVLAFSNMELNGIFWNPWGLEVSDIKEIRGSDINQGDNYLFAIGVLPASMKPRAALNDALSVEQRIEKAVRLYLELLKQGKWESSLSSYFPPKKINVNRERGKRILKKYQRFAEKLILNYEYYPEPGTVNVKSDSAKIKWGELTFVLKNIQGKWMINRIY